MKHLYIKLSAIFICTAGFASAQVVTTLAGSTTSGLTNATGTAARFSGPVGVATDASGNLYVADQVNNKIRKIVISTGVVTTLAGSASFNFPAGVATDASGNLYVADRGNNEIRKIVISSGVVTTLAGSTTSGSADGTGASASFNGPAGLVADGSGNLFVADTYNHEIRKIVIATGVVTTLAGNTISTYADGTGAAASFSYPNGVAIDGSGNLYVADGGNNVIRKIVISSAVVTTLAGTTTSGTSNGTGAAASFNNPTGVAYDGMGNLFVADDFNNEIRRIVISSAAVTTTAGTVTVGAADGTGTAASFNAPTGIATDATGNLYVADRYNNEIRKITAPLGITQYSMPSTQLSIFPNPANQTLNVKFSQPLQYATTLKIMDVTGRELSSQNVNKMQDILSVDVAGLPAGVYFISMENSKAIFVKQ